MKKQTLLLLCLLLCNAANIFAQDNLRNMVCVVRPQLPDAMKMFYEEYGRALSREGYVRSGALLRSRESGGFGSGVVVQREGKFYVLTNFHVVEHAESVSLEFQANADSPLQLKDCRIVARDSDYDLALIALPAGAGIQSGFTFSGMTVKEGVEVWSAGFPGLGNRPSWQLGRGIVSNESIKDSLLTNTKLLFVMQHTAQVDAGSSGGALLIASSNEPSGYSIVGINTWKARGREGANFAIPGKAAMSFLESAKSMETSANFKQQIETQTKTLLAAKNYKDIVPLISRSYIFSISVTAFIEMFTGASKDAKDAADKAFRQLEPFDGFCIIIADAFYQKIKNTTSVYIDTGEEFASRATINRKETEMTWTREGENWLLMSSALLQESGTGRSYTRMWDDVGYAVSLGIGFPLDDVENIAYTLNWGRRYSKNFAMLWELTYGKKKIEPIDIDDKDYLGYVGIAVGIDLQVPLKFSRLYTNPYVKVPVGYNTGKDFGETYFGVRPGVRFATQVGKKAKFLFLDVEYRYKNAFSQKGDYDFPKTTSMFGLSLGYAF